MKAIKTMLTASAVVVATAALSGCNMTSSSGTSSAAADTNSAVPAQGFAEGAKVYAIVNLHSDSPKNKLYAMNYQLPKMLPICSEFVIQDISTKVIELTYKGLEYDYVWDGHTKKAGQSLEENFMLFFGESCDEAKAKVKTLSEVDQKGIKRGKPIVGMTKEGVLLAMGRPPIHATPDLEGDLWTYWINRWVRNILEFNEKGELVKIIK